MKAVIRHRYGPLSSVQFGDVPVPVPGEGEILIRVHATTVNRTDLGVVTGKPLAFRLFVGVPQPRYIVLGTDLAGEVVKTGKSVTNYTPGDKVFAFNDNGLPSQAEYCCLPSNSPNLSKMPEEVDFLTAAASLEGPHYARNFLRAAGVKKGQRVLVHGATGGIGSAAVQLLIHYGVRVTATAPTDHLDTVRALGPERVIDWQVEELKDAGRNFDFVFDTVGKSSYGYCKPLLGAYGAYLSSELGPRNENPFLALAGLLRNGRRVIFPLPQDISGTLSLMRELLASGVYQPLIDRTYPLSDAADAYGYVATGQKTGNVVLQVSKG